jgi:CO/xanthine dehydrogenase Mo-binding subunit
LTTPSRRSFLKMSWGLVTLIVTPVSLPGCGGAPDAPTGSDSWSGEPGQARYRIDGLAKVLGKKIYARDFRVADMPGWPNRQRMALVVRAAHADRPYQGLDLSILPSELRPLQVIDQARLDADKVTNIFGNDSPQGSGKQNRPQSFLVHAGQVPVFQGEPLAILLFSDWETCRRARRILQFNTQLVRYGATPVARQPEWQPYRPPLYLTRYSGESGDLFSQTLNGVTDPYLCPQQAADLAATTLQGSIEQLTSAVSGLDVNCAAAAWRKRIDWEMSTAQSRGWKIYQSKAATQSLDPMFMEPEAGLAWYDASNPAAKRLSLVLGTQSPNGDIADALAMFDAKGCPFQVSTVQLTSCYPGGGFGGRDVSTFPPLLMLAAVYADGPVRMANDRFEQFQSGLKQLGSQIEIALAVNPDGRFEALRSTALMQAGGKNNYSQFVAELAGYCANNAYSIPRASVDATAEPSAGVVAGSMRGFGGPQAFFALETALDQVARDLRIDPIELRRRNVLRKERGDRTVTGAPLVDPLPLVEICDRAGKNPLWVDKEAQKARRGGTSRLYGVGFALANEAFGTGSDGVLGAVSVNRDGSIKVITNAVDIGTGSATTLAIVTARHLGRNASEIEPGQAGLFTANLKLSSTPEAEPDPQLYRKRSHVLFQRLRASAVDSSQDQWSNPNYTASFSMSSSASITAFHQVHAVHQASLALFEAGVWPAAASLWGIDPSNRSAREAARWVDERLSLQGHEALSWPQLAERMYARDAVVSAMVHACFQAHWVTAEYPLAQWVGYPAIPRWPIDGLALRRASQAPDQYTQILRANTTPPPPLSGFYGRSLYAPSATLAAVEVARPGGDVRVLELHTYLDAGTVLQPDFVSGQYQGAAAMGIGYALLEELPVLDGPGLGRWNLNRYAVALAVDVPIDNLRLELLPPTAKDAPAKGIAEAVLCPIAPAIANAIADATGFVFSQLPITARAIRDRWSQQR